MKHLVEWDSLDVRVDGERLAEMARQMVAADPMIERIALRFSNGLLRVEGTARKLIRFPFSVEIRRIEPEGTVLRVPLHRVTAGPLPVPSLIMDLFQDFFPRDLVRYEEPATLVLSLERFLPSFVAADIQKVWIIDGGLAVSLGRGGADLPPGGSDELRGR